jgi:hypothetical protein
MAKLWLDESDLGKIETMISMVNSIQETLLPGCKTFKDLTELRFKLKKLIKDN